MGQVDQAQEEATARKRRTKDPNHRHSRAAAKRGGTSVTTDRAWEDTGLNRNGRQAEAGRPSPLREEVSSKFGFKCLRWKGKQAEGGVE